MRAGSPSPLDAPLDMLRAVCPRCRRLVPRAVPCGLDGAGVLDLTEPAHRERLVEAAWGSTDQRAALRQHAGERGALRLGTGVGGFMLGFAAMQAANVEGVVAAVMAMFGGAMGAAIIGARPRTLVPIDAQPLPAWPRIGLGRIVEAGAIEAPGSRLRCAAWAVELTYDGSWGTRTTLRAGASAGFDVVLDGGERVRIPPGPLWLAGPLLQVDGEDARVEEMLAALDPAGRTADWALFPFNVITEQTLDDGARVEVLGEVEARPDAEGAPLLYREAAPTVLRHATLPVLRRAERAPRGT